MAGLKRKNRNGKATMSLTTRILGFVVSIALLGLLTVYMWREYTEGQAAIYDQPVVEQVDEPIPQPEPAPEVQEEPEFYYPIGVFIDTPQRKAYVDGDLVLGIPRIGYEGPVLNGVTDDVLERGVGLFDQAQLPGPMEQNGNVSIAGHRDIHGSEFYDIDKIAEGDEIRLTYQDSVYLYRVEQSFVTHSEDWEPIKVQEYPCVTLQSCTPIGSAIDRIFVVGRLVEITPASVPEADGGEDATDSESGAPGTVQLPGGQPVELDGDKPTQV